MVGAERPGWITHLLKALVLLPIIIVVIFPFINVLAVSFSSYADIAGKGVVLFPSNPTLDAYTSVLMGNVVTRSLRVTILITLAGTALNIILTVTMAYGLSRRGMVGGRVLLLVVLLTLLFSPGLIPTICWSSSLA